MVVLAVPWYHNNWRFVPSHEAKFMQKLIRQKKLEKLTSLISLSGILMMFCKLIIQPWESQKCKLCNYCQIEVHIHIFMSWTYLSHDLSPDLWLSRVIRRVLLVEQELLPLPEHQSSPPVFSWVRVTQSLVVCVCFVYRCLSFWPLCCLFFDIWILITTLVSSLHKWRNKGWYKMGSIGLKVSVVWVHYHM